MEGQAETSGACLGGLTKVRRTEGVIKKRHSLKVFKEMGLEKKKT